MTFPGSWYGGGGGGSGAPTDADYLIGTANGSLSNEIVVGTAPGGELGGTWASPTVDATHSGSAHLKIVTGSYTGDGATSQAISGLGITPKFVWITRRLTANGDFNTGEVIWTTDVIIDDIAAGAAVNVENGAGVVAIVDDAIIALASDSFTVDDNGTDADPNANTVVYNYVAIGT